MSSVTIQNVTKSFGNTVVLENFDAVFQNGEFVTLLGPSGCGKTTMLRIIAGFEKPTSGCVKFDDRVVSSDKVFIPPEKRDIGMVFQSYAVWPHMTVFDNVAYGLKLRKVPKEEIQRRVTDILALVELSGMESRMTNQLSGGQQQRVSIGRALINAPSVVLADEPTGNLDRKNSQEIVELLKYSNRQYGQTLIVITHDESIALQADRVLAIEDGHIVRDEVIRK